MAQTTVVANIRSTRSSVSATIKSQEYYKEIYLVDENGNFIADENGGNIITGREIDPYAHGITAILS